MIIKHADFVISNSDYKKCPADRNIEFAFIGRSNVGKSSLINMLCSKKDLAKTSSKPGKTQLINHFLINSEWYLVDLPGYGYAKTSKSNRKEFSKMITNYVLKAKNLTLLFVLIDSRLEPQKIDLEFINFLGKNNVPFSIIFTKTDKESKRKVEQNFASFKKALLMTWEELPEIFLASSLTKAGKDDILAYIDKLRLNSNHLL